MPARDIIQKMRPEVLWSDVELHDLLPANADYVVNKGSLYAVQYNYNATTKWHDFIVLRYDKDLCSTIVDDIEERKKILENVDFPCSEDISLDSKIYVNDAFDDWLHRVMLVMLTKSDKYDEPPNKDLHIYVSDDGILFSENMGHLETKVEWCYAKVGSQEILTTFFGGGSCIKLPSNEFYNSWYRYHERSDQQWPPKDIVPSINGYTEIVVDIDDRRDIERRIRNALFRPKRRYTFPVDIAVICPEN